LASGGKSYRFELDSDLAGCLNMQTTTLLAVPPDQGIEMIRARAIERSLPYKETSDGLKLELPWGQLLAIPERKRLRLTLNASDSMKLHLLQEAVDHRLDEMLVAPDRRWSQVDVGQAPPSLTFAKVVSCERLSPSYYRVRLSGPELDRFSRDGLHFRLLFPPDGNKGEWPYISETGRTDWPGGIAAWHRPVYTTRRFEPETAALEFDVFTHSGGRVTEWCETSKAGMDVAMMGPGGEWLPTAKWIALFGDETALPAIARILENLSAEVMATASVLISDRRDAQPLPERDSISVRWLVRGEGVSLIDALRELDIPDKDRFVWFAGERSEVNEAREILLARGLQKAEIRAASYWSR
jgi:ferric-chelate reductase (NADPH)